MHTRLHVMRLTLLSALVVTSVGALTPAGAVSCENNSAPIARAGNDLMINRGDSAQFDARETYDPNGDPLTYRWDFDSTDGIGTDVSGVSAYWPGYQPGTYTVTLQASDGCATAADSLTVTVVEGFLFDLSVSRAQANPGDGIGYMVSFTNRTSRHIENAVISLDYDERYLTATELNGGYLDGGRLTYRQERIVQGLSETRAFWFRVADQMPYGETVLLASATLTARDLNNQHSRSVQTAVGARPTLVVSVSSDKTSVGRGDIASYSFMYQNHGNSPADRTQVYFDFDETNTDVVNATGGPVNEGRRLRWDIGTFYPGQKSSQSVTLRVRTSAIVSEMRNLVRITADNARNFDQIITTSVAGIGSLSPGLRLGITASDENEFFAASLSSHRNELATMNLTVTNGSNYPAEHVLVNMDFDETVFKIYERGGAADSGTDASWDFARLEAGETRTFQIVLQARADAPLYRPTATRAAVSARNAPSASAEIITTIAEGSVKVKGFAVELPRTGGSLFPIILVFSSLIGIATYLKNGRAMT